MVTTPAIGAQIEDSTPSIRLLLQQALGGDPKVVEDVAEETELREALALALAVYPEAKVGEEASGVVLYPSLPAVPRAEAKRLGLG